VPCHCSLLLGLVLPLYTACAIRIISVAISSGERIKSIHPLSVALKGISGCAAVSSFCAIVMPATSFMLHRAARTANTGKQPFTMIQSN
jgi:hypothetical protein